jgi:VanZ family protein
MSGRTAASSAWLLFGCWMLVVFGLSSIPNLSPPAAELPLADKLCHLGEYAVLGALFARGLGGAGRGAARAVLPAALVGMLVGALDEFYQSLVPGRSTSGWDWLADTAGAALGGLAWTRYRHRRPTA